MGRDFPADERISLRLWSADAVVLFDWLMRLDFDRVPVNHKAEKQALADLLNVLEQTSIMGITKEDIDRARVEVAKDMGWE
jgi:hypothetical protein